MKRLFTSESVGAGHPDKVCDQISDAILDECLRRDPNAHVACESFVTKQFVLVSGEISGNSNISGIDYEGIARKVIRDIGYTTEESGINPDTCEVLVKINEQSGDIAMGVDRDGAGDQGMMFGFATKETKSYMPLAIYLSHQMMKKADLLRKSGKFVNSLPDMKCQVTVDYTDYAKPIVTTVVFSAQHKADANLDEFKAYIKENIINVVLKENGFNYDDIEVYINPTGRFSIGGPLGDTGLTGRKIIVDTYGGYCGHGGGAFSGKDPTKVDRSAAYMARYIAKNVVAAGLSDKIEIQLAYAIGQKDPVSVTFKTFGTSHVSDDIILKAILDNFELTPKGIINTLGLRNPIYQQTATFGHFGRDDLDLSWEKLDKVDILKSYIK